MLVHRTALTVCGAVAEPDVNRPALGCVHVRADGTVEATNGAILLQVKNASWPAEEYPKIDGLEVGAPGPALLTVESVNQAIKFVPKKTVIPILQCVAVVPKNGHVTLAVHDMENVQRIELNRVEGDFPNTDRVVDATPKPAVSLTLSVDVLDLLVKALKLAKARTVVLGVSKGPKIPLTVKAEGPDITITGLVAPMETK